jgi:hypothetical protein
MNPAVQHHDLAREVAVAEHRQGEVSHLGGLAERPTGTTCVISPGSPGSMPVSSIRAGAIALTVTPSAATRDAKKWVRPCSPAFDDA